MKIKDFKALIIKELTEYTGKVSSDNIEILQKPDFKGLGSSGKVFAKLCAKEESGSVKSVIVNDEKTKIVFCIYANSSNAIRIDDILKWANASDTYDNYLLCYRNTHGRNIVVDKVIFKKRDNVLSIVFETKI